MSEDLTIILERPPIRVLLSLDLFFIFKYFRKATDMFLPIAQSILLKNCLLREKRSKKGKKKKVWLGGFLCNI